MALFRRRREGTTASPHGAHPAARSPTSDAAELARRRRVALLPPRVVEMMADYGRAECHGENQFLAPGPYHVELQRLAPEVQRGRVAALRDAVLEAGGWAIPGAATVVMRALGHPLGIPAYCELLDASLAFQRAEGLWDDQLSINEKTYWRERHGDELWQQPRDPPSRDEASITELPIGGERKLTVLSRWPNSRALYVARPQESVYVVLLEYSDDSGKRVREQQATRPDLYNLYCAVAEYTFAPCHWVNEELEPFFPVATPPAVKAPADAPVTDPSTRPDFRKVATAAVSLASDLHKQGDDVGAARELRRAADLGDWMAAYNLGTLISRTGDPDDVAGLYRQAEFNGVKQAACNLGTVLEARGHRDGAEAAYRRAADSGDDLGAYYLALMLEDEADWTGAAAALRRASELGNADAMQRLADRYS